MAEFRFNISEERIVRNFGPDFDEVTIDANDPTDQIRVLFTPQEVGNGDPRDSNEQENQDGGLAVRLQAEDEEGNGLGRVSRTDDEGIRFISGTEGVTFDVRDIVTGVERGSDFDVVTLGTRLQDVLDDSGDMRNHYYNGGAGNDRIEAGDGDDFIEGGSGSDRLIGNDGDDTFLGDSGVDRIFGGRGEDVAFIDTTTDNGDNINLGDGDDTVKINTAVLVDQIRLTFTTSEVGNGNARDGGDGTNEDGGFAVRLQSEDFEGGLSTDLSRVDDEGVTFRSTVEGVTFDIRDLVSGSEVGDFFTAATLGTTADDTYDQTGSMDNWYINGGAGDDDITGGSGMDFLAGVAGRDRLVGLNGGDDFDGGGGNDLIYGGNGRDRAIFNVLTDGSDRANLGAGLDRVQVFAEDNAPVSTTTQIRLTFTSSEVGNGDARDSDTQTGQDGGFAVRLQAEGAGDQLTGPVSRFDDEGIVFVTPDSDVTFDVRDLVSGTERGDQFSVVQLGTSSGDTFNATQEPGNYYMNGGAGDDRLTGSTGEDFVVGGVGNDVLNGKADDDSLLGGMGEDIFVFNGAPGNDEILDFVSGTDRIDLSGYGISQDDVETRSEGEDTILEVDANQDGTSDFEITLVNSGPPAPTDYMFG